MTAQIIYLVLLFVGLLIEANQHGKDKKGKHNFFTSFIAMTIQIGLMYWGGFFDIFFK